MTTSIANYAGGHWYYGEFNNHTNKREGKGVFLFGDGAVHIGNYHNDQFNGEGIYYYPDGSEERGVFEDDKF